MSAQEFAMQERLEELRGEYRRGLNELALLDQRRQELNRTLLRISGAIQVLEELLEGERGAGGDGLASSEPAIQVVGG